MVPKLTSSSVPVPALPTFSTLLVFSTRPPLISAKPKRTGRFADIDAATANVHRTAGLDEERAAAAIADADESTL